ncbi:MAG: hypothetical protein M3447_10735 [Acidobacteriota bacterium]|nr:hypothetical protein [Acidobacteriota bacterium]
MRFEYYHPGLDNVPKLSVDGTVPNSVHFSHWEGNETPVALKADTSTEIALNLVASPQHSQFTRGIELVTNNHFDADGVLSVWTVLNGNRVLEFRELLISTAEAGDFSELTSEAGVRASIAIQGSDQAGNETQEGSPLAQFLNGGYPADDAKAYELVLPEVEKLITNIDAYEHLWRDGWELVATAIESFEKGASVTEELPEVSTTLVTLSPDIFGPAGFDPKKHGVPVIAISRYAHGELFLIATPYESGWSYRFDYPYYSWAETVVRPKIERRDLTLLLARLNQIERNSKGKWQLDRSEMTSAIKFLDGRNALAASELQPDEVAAIVRSEHLSRSAGVK